MSLSSLYRFALKLKGRGHFLSPKEVIFLKNLLKEFSEEEIKRSLERCFKEVIPPSEREKSSLLRCKKLFEVSKSGKEVYFRPQKLEKVSLKSVIERVPPDRRSELVSELKETLRREGLKPTEENVRKVLSFLIRKYL